MSVPATDVTWLAYPPPRALADERAEFRRTTPKRADLMPAAAVLADFAAGHRGRTGAVACTWALREGITC